VGLVDISGVTLGFFLLATVFILSIGSFLSFGVLRLFQQRFRSGIINLVSAVCCTVLLVIVMNNITL